MKLNAKISEIASPKTVFDKKSTSRVCHLPRRTRRSTVWASSKQNVGLVDFVPAFAEKRPRSGGRGGVGGEARWIFFKEAKYFHMPLLYTEFFFIPPPPPLFFTKLRKIHNPPPPSFNEESKLWAV